MQYCGALGVAEIKKSRRFPAETDKSTIRVRCMYLDLSV